MINKLVDKIKKTNAPIVVGLDPMLSYVPEHITKKAFDELGETPAGAAEAIWQYNKAIVDATYDLIPLLYCQIASAAPSSVSPNSLNAASWICFGI